MSEIKHTPGPWRTMPEECDKPYLRVRGTQLGKRYKVANVLTPAYEGFDERETEETRANARLIAAAPELLEALQWCVDQGWVKYHLRLKQNTNFCDGVDAVHAAIAKATGSQP